MIWFLSAVLHAASVVPNEANADPFAEAEVVVERFGRYSLSVSSALGTSLTVVDRMAGPLPTAGQPGEQDGRMDLFLDRGTHKIRLEGLVDDSEPVQLSVTEFEELETEARVLQDGRLVQTSLGDFSQRSYWIEITATERVFVEAAGRHLTDLRVWKDGTWLHGAQPSCQTTMPEEGKPLWHCTLDASLSPGLYRVTAYGGASQAWTTTGDEQPLYVRRGVPALGDVGQRTTTISPFGVDRYRIDSAYVHLSLPTVTAVTLAGHDASRGAFGAPQYVQHLAADARHPVVEMDFRSNRSRYVRVEGTAGQSYTLQHFTPVGGFRPDSQRPQPARARLQTHPQPSWVSTLTAGNGADSIDVTGLLLVREEQGLVLVDASGVSLGADQRYSRRINLPGHPVSMLLDVQDDGDWRFEMLERTGTLQLSPVMLDGYLNTTESDVRRSPQELTLSKGLYLLSIQADEPGIATLDIRPRRGRDALPVVAPLRAAQFANVETEGVSDGVWLLQFGDPQQRMGVVQRTMPMDLSVPLPVTLPPNAQVDLLLDVTRRGGLVVDGAEGVVEVRLDREVFAQGGQVWPMRHDLQLTNLTDSPQQVIARLVSPEQEIPVLPEESQQSLPEFPVLRSAEFVPLDLEAGETETVVVNVDAPGLYTVTTEGLLATKGTLRTRTNPQLDLQAQNGPGRNMQLRQYLREGEYQVTTQAIGYSAGHLRIRLAAAELLDGGTLRPDRPARTALSGGEGVVYVLDVPTDGQWRIHSTAQGNVPRCRLEDAEGWPVLPPNIPADLTVPLTAGQYRLVLLPESVDARYVTSLSPVVSPEQRAGHGPHALPLGEPVSHRWLEPQDGGQRLPDLWTFSLAAPSALSIALSDEMSGQLFHDGQLLEHTEGMLPAGDYQLSVRRTLPDHGHPYTVTVRADHLTAGHRRTCSTPCAIPISANGLTEIRTTGDDDVAIQLYDGQRLVASSDDRPGGWNALLVDDLPAGSYMLHVTAVGQRQGLTTVAMRAPQRQEKPAVQAGALVVVEPGDDVVEYPLTGMAGEVVLAAGRSGENIGMAVVENGRILAADQGSDVRVSAWLSEAPAVLRVWSLDRRGEAVEVQVERAQPRRHAPGAMSAPTQLNMAAFAVLTRRGGALSVDGEHTVHACVAPGAPCVPVEQRLAVQSSETMLIAHAASEGRRLSLRVQEQRLQPGAWQRLDVPAGGARWALDDPGGPVLVMVNAQGVQPGLRLLGSSEASADPTAASVAATSRGLRVVARSRMTDAVAEIWPADHGSEMAARVQLWTFPAPTTGRLSTGAQDVLLPSGQAIHRVLPGTNETVLSLPKGFVAIVSVDGVEHTHHAESDAKTIAVADAEAVTVLNPTTDDGRVRLQRTAMVSAPATLLPNEVQSWSVLRRQTQRLRVPMLSEAGWTVNAVGGVEALRWMGHDGQTAVTDSGAPLAVGAQGGWLEVDGGPGTIMLWLDGPQGQSGLLAGDVAPESVSLPSVVPWQGAQGHWLAEGRPGDVLTVAVDVPSVLRVQVTGGHAKTVMLPQGGGTSVPLVDGTASIITRALGDGRSAGHVSIMALPPEAMDDGVHAPLALLPGEQRWLSFEIDAAEQDVGIGVDSDSDRLDVVLLSATGVVLGEGLVQRQHLTRGQYFLGLSLPADAAPTSARPALVGRQAPGHGPPADVIRQYGGQQ